MLEETFCPAARRVARIVFRALDYLPPGEVSFVDYGRAFLTAAAATYRRPQKEQGWLTDEFVRRGIVSTPEELTTEPSVMNLKKTDFKQLVEDESAAQSFVDQHSALLGIPARRKFEVLQPEVASRSFGSRQAKDSGKELIFKVRWNMYEKHDLGKRFPSKWKVAQGTTLVLDISSGRILSLLTTDNNDRQRLERRALLRRWANEGRLLPESESIGPDGKSLVEAVIARTIRGAAYTEGSGNALHMTAEEL
jgi:hypothetical protein